SKRCSAVRVHASKSPLGLASWDSKDAATIPGSGSETAGRTTSAPDSPGSTHVPPHRLAHLIGHFRGDVDHLFSDPFSRVDVARFRRTCRGFFLRRRAASTWLPGLDSVHLALDRTPAGWKHRLARRSR